MKCQQLLGFFGFSYQQCLGICCVLCLLCHYCIFSVNCVISVFLQYFDTVGWLRPVKTVARITYTVLVETLNPAQSINQSIV